MFKMYGPLGQCEYTLVAVKRQWVPEWLWSMFKWVIPYQPFRWIFTTPVEPISEESSAS